MFHDRRRLVPAVGFGVLIAAAGPAEFAVAGAASDPSAALYPALRNGR